MTVLRAGLQVFPYGRFAGQPVALNDAGMGTRLADVWEWAK